MSTCPGSPLFFFYVTVTLVLYDAFHPKQCTPSHKVDGVGSFKLYQTWCRSRHHPIIITRCHFLTDASCFRIVRKRTFFLYSMQPDCASFGSATRLRGIPTTFPSIWMSSYMMWWATRPRFSGSIHANTFKNQAARLLLRLFSVLVDVLAGF